MRMYNVCVEVAREHDMCAPGGDLDHSPLCSGRGIDRKSTETPRKPFTCQEGLALVQRDLGAVCKVVERMR